VACFAESATTLSDHRHFSNDFMLEVTASSSHSDDVMIRSLRMTVASLKQSMDRRFTRLERRMHRQFVSVDKRLAAVDRRFDDLEARLTARIDMRFESISAKMDSIAKGFNQRLNHHAQVDDEHEKRLRELEDSAPSA
jgi:phosphatidylserine/phosphatidylglycerophosphate/cardiolipin synthase-like enzyme